MKEPVCTLPITWKVRRRLSVDRSQAIWSVHRSCGPTQTLCYMIFETVFVTMAQYSILFIQPVISSNGVIPLERLQLSLYHHLSPCWFYWWQSFQRHYLPGSETSWYGLRQVTVGRWIFFFVLPPSLQPMIPNPWTYWAHGSKGRCDELRDSNGWLFEGRY